MQPGHVTAGIEFNLPTVWIVGLSDIRCQDPSSNACINAQFADSSNCIVICESVLSSLFGWVLRRLPQECRTSRMLHMNVLAFFFFCSESGNLAKWSMHRVVLKPLTERGMRLVLEEFAAAVELAE